MIRAAANTDPTSTRAPPKSRMPLAIYRRLYRLEDGQCWWAPPPRSARLSRASLKTEAPAETLRSGTAGVHIEAGRGDAHACHAVHEPRRSPHSFFVAFDTLTVGTVRISIWTRRGCFEKVNVGRDNAAQQINHWTSPSCGRNKAPTRQGIAHHP